MSSENTPQTQVSITGHDDDAARKIRLPAFQTLLASLSTPRTLRYRPSERPNIRNSISCTPSSSRTLSPPVSGSSEESVSSGTHTDTGGDGIENDGTIEQTSKQVAQWIEEYNAANYDSPTDERSSSEDSESLHDDVDMASPPNHVAGEGGAPEDLATEHAAALPNHALSPEYQPEFGDLFRATEVDVHPLGARRTQFTFPMPPKPPQGDHSWRLAASSRGISPRAVSPEPQPGMASPSSVHLPAQTSCACSICERSGNPMLYQQSSAPGAQTIAHESFPSENDGMRLQYSSDSPPAGPTYGATLYDTVAMKVAPAPAFSSGVAPHGRLAQMPQSERFHSFWVNNVRALVWNEYTPPGEKAQQGRSKPRGAKRKRSSDSRSASRKKRSHAGSSTSNSSTIRLSPDDTGKSLMTDLDDGNEAGAQKCVGESKDNPTEPIEHVRPHPVGLQKHDNQEANVPSAENLSGLPWYAVPRPSDIYITVDSKSAANVEGRSSDRPVGKEATDERKQGQQAFGVQVEGASENVPDREDHEGQSESNRMSDGSPWYAHRRSTDIYISVD